MMYRYRTNAFVPDRNYFYPPVERQSSRGARWLSKIVSTARPRPPVPSLSKKLRGQNEKRKPSALGVGGEAERKREKESSGWGQRGKRDNRPLSCRSAVRLPAVTSPLFTPTPSTPSAPFLLYFYISSLRYPLCDRFALLWRALTNGARGTTLSLMTGYSHSNTE